MPVKRRIVPRNLTWVRHWVQNDEIVDLVSALEEAHVILNDHRKALRNERISERIQTSYNFTPLARRCATPYELRPVSGDLVSDLTLGNVH
jgi:hypothetical protein